MMDRTYWLFDERDDSLWYCDECGAAVPKSARAKHDDWHDAAVIKDARLGGPSRKTHGEDRVDGD